MTRHALSLLTLLLAASAAVASPATGYHKHLHRRTCSAVDKTGTGGSGGKHSTYGNNLAVDPPQLDPTKQDPTKQDPTKQDPTKQDPTKQDPPRQDPPKQDPPKQDPPKQNDNGDTDVDGSDGSGGGANDREVFAHFMVGITSTYGQVDYERDMRLAKEYGITAFALNVGKDSYTELQLSYAYNAAVASGFKVFVSFDFNWFKPEDTQLMVEILKPLVNHKGQYKVNGAAFVSSFLGMGFNWNDVEKGLGHKIYAVPNWIQGTYSADQIDTLGVKGLFSWMAWPSQDNKPVPGPLGTDVDKDYATKLGTDKVYMAPVSPFFFTHYGTEVSYSKNWLFKTETLWVDRWKDLLYFAKDNTMTKYIEILSWNDYGESHYVGTVDSPHTDDGASKWTKGMDHRAMMDLAKPYITAFKKGETRPIVEKEGLVYWYRPHPKTVECDSTDNCGAKPAGWELVEDMVYVALMTKSGGSATITSGSNKPINVKTADPVSVFAVPMGVGEQKFVFSNSAGGNVEGKSTLPIKDECWTTPEGQKIYNFNFHSGVVWA